MIDVLITCERCGKISRTEQSIRREAEYYGGHSTTNRGESDGYIGEDCIILSPFHMVRSDRSLDSSFSLSEKKVILCRDCQKQIEEDLNKMIIRFNENLAKMFSVKGDTIKTA